MEENNCCVNCNRFMDKEYLDEDGYCEDCKDRLFENLNEPQEDIK